MYKGFDKEIDWNLVKKMQFSNLGDPSKIELFGVPIGNLQKNSIFQFFGYTNFWTWGEAFACPSSKIRESKKLENWTFSANSL